MKTVDEQMVIAVERYLNDNQALRQAVGAQPDWPLHAVLLGAGEHNVSYTFQPRPGYTCVLRVNVAMQPFHTNQISYEYAALQALAPSGCTPLPLYVDPQAPLGHGVLVESFCEGALLDCDALQPGQLNAAARLMAQVHATPVPAECTLHRPVNAAEELFAECCERYEIYEASGMQEPRISRRVQRFMHMARTELDALSTQQVPACIINTEPLPSHFLLPRKAAQNTSQANSEGYFIDWERPVIGDPAQDVAYFTSPTSTGWDSAYLMPPHVADEVLCAYEEALDNRLNLGNFPQRYRMYRVLTALRSITWCCRALVYSQQPQAYLTEKARQKLPQYLSDDFLDFVMQTLPH